MNLWHDVEDRDKPMWSCESDRWVRDWTTSINYSNSQWSIPQMKSKETLFTQQVFNNCIEIDVDFG